MSIQVIRKMKCIDERKLASPIKAGVRSDSYLPANQCSSPIRSMSPEYQSKSRSHEHRDISLSPERRFISISLSPERRGRSLSPENGDRSLSPERRGRSRSMSPEHRNRSLSPENGDRSLSPENGDRSLSPERRGRSRSRNRSSERRGRSLSPENGDRSLSPERRGRSRSRSRNRSSERRGRSRSRSLKNRSRSRSRNRSSEHQSRAPNTRNTGRQFKSRQRTPIRHYTNSRIGQSGKFHHQNRPNNNQMGGFGTRSRSLAKPQHVRKYNTNTFGLRVKAGKNNFLPSTLFQLFADMLNKYGNSSRFDKSVEEMENMFRGVETTDQLISQIGLDKALRILSMYVMTNGKFRKAYKGSKNSRNTLFEMF